MTIPIKSIAWLSVATLTASAVAYRPFGRPRAGQVPRHVLLISIDTLRADHCGFLGYDRPTTPFLDGLAESGVVFEDHRVHSNHTLVSHTSILTGRLPEAEGERAKLEGPGFGELPGRSLAEAFQAAGFTTAAFTGHPLWLGADFGLDRGFDVHESDWALAPETTARFLGWLDRAEPEHLFAFLHFFDAHAEAPAGPDTLPYDSSPELIAQFAGPRPKGWTGRARGNPELTASRYLSMVGHGIEPLGPGHLDYVVGLYDAGLRKLDDDLRYLFGELERRGLLEDALVVVTSDHGEEFMEHGGMLHESEREAVMRVPLVIVPPQRPRHAGGSHAGQRITSGSRAIDIAPTLLDFVGAPPVGGGSSLLPTILRERRRSSSEAGRGATIEAAPAD